MLGMSEKTIKMLTILFLVISVALLGYTLYKRRQSSSTSLVSTGSAGSVVPSNKEKYRRTAMFDAMIHSADSHN